NVPKATRHSADAFRTESFNMYCQNADTAPAERLRDDLRTFTLLADSVSTMKTFCVNGGESIILIRDAQLRRGPVGTVVGPILRAAWTKEFAKRQKEFSDIVDELLEAAFGDARKDLIEVFGLATAPEKQGQGYATALMHIVNDMSDVQGRGVYLVTTDAYRFFEPLGYSIVQEGFIGVDNPKWSGPPVAIRIVNEKPTACLTEESEQSVLATLLRYETTVLPIMRPMRYRDVPNAAKTSYDAILDDPLTQYLNDVDTAPGLEWRQKLAHAISLTDHVNRNAASTIGGGDAILTLGYPGNRRSQLPPGIISLLNLFDTRELTKRKHEYVDKISVMLKNTFPGDSIEDMIEVEGLATSPARQGHGYGTVLMLFVNAMADVQKRGVYIVTSNSHGFYKRFGYSIVQEDALGVDNPAWKGEPVPLRVMYRRPNKFPITNDSDTTLLS
ncbi:hypothetical protein BC628DRAFT_1309639, partial [Trametes gibbosa]